MVRNNFMMHLCTVATLCFLEKTFPRNYYYSDQDDNSLSLCFKSMYLTLFVAIFTSNFIFSMSKSFHTYRNINIRDLQCLSCQNGMSLLQGKHHHQNPAQDGPPRLAGCGDACHHLPLPLRLDPLLC